MAYGNAGYNNAGNGQQTRSVYQDNGASKTLTQETFVSDESGKVTSNKIQLTCAPKAEATDAANPYKVMNQKTCALQIRLMPYQGNTGGARSEFNISWPQAKLITDVAEQSMIFPISNWDLADKWNKTNELERVFGDPLPPSVIMQKFPGRFQSQQEAAGYCRARIMILRRTTKRPDGQIQRLPWYIQIMNGYAKKIQVGNGGACMERKSFLQETEAHTNVADGDMFNMFFWNEAAIRALMSSGTPNLVRTHNELLKKRREWIARQSGYQN